MKGFKLVCIFFIFVLVFIIRFPEETLASDANVSYLQGTFGTIRKEIVINQTQYFAITMDYKLFLMQNNEIIKELEFNSEVLSLDVISDANANGYDELLLTMSSTQYDNILLIDTKNYEQLWSYSMKLDAFDEAMGYYKQIEKVSNHLIDDNKLIFTVYNVVFSLNMEGHILWTVKNEQYINKIEAIGDINKDNKNDYVYSNQGNIVAISGKNGQKLYSKPITESYSFFHETRIAEIFDLDYDSDSEILYVTSESGFVYRVNPLTGTKVTEKNKREISNFTEIFMNQSYYEAKNRPFSIEVIGDINDDGVNDLLYYQLLDNELGSDNERNNLASNNKIIALSGKDLSTIYETDYLDIPVFGYSYQRMIYKNEDVFLFLEQRDYNATTVTYKLFSIKTGEYLKQTLTLPVEDMYYGNYKMVPTLDEIYYFSDGGLYIFSLSENENEIASSITCTFPKSITTKTLFTQDRYYIVKNIYNFNTRFAIVAYDQTTNQILWNYQLSDEQRQNTNGFRIVNYEDDYNGDGINDIVLLLNGQTDIDKPSVCPNLITIDGKTGKPFSYGSLPVIFPENDLNFEGNYSDYLSNIGYNQEQIQDVMVVDDLNDNGSKDIMLKNLQGDCFFYDIKLGLLINYFTKNTSIDFKDTSHISSIDFTNVFKVNDLNQDGIKDFINIENQEIKLMNYLNGQWIVSDNTIATMPGTTAFYANNYGDLDGDGLDELGFVTNSDEMNMDITIISSKTGKPIGVVQTYDSTFIKNSGLDMNGDGINEMIEYIPTQINMGFYSNVCSFNVIDIVNNTVLFASDSNILTSSFENSYTVFEDGGHFYIAFSITEQSMLNQYISVYDIVSKELVNEIEVSKGFNEPRGDYNIVLNNIGSFEYNQDIYLYRDNLIYQYETGKLVLQDQFPIQSIITTENQIFINSNNAKLILTSLENKLDILNLTDQEKVNKVIDLKFTNNNHAIINLYVDDVLVGFTTDSHYKLYLLEGKHQIKVVQNNENGIQYTKTIVVIVEKNYLLSILIPSITFIAIAGVIVIPRRKRKYFIPKDLLKGSETK